MATDSNKAVDKIALIKAFESTALLIEEMSSEYVELQTKFGTSSKLAKKKHEQVLKLKHFYTTTQNYINYMRELIYKTTINYDALQLHAMHHDTGLPYEKVARALNLPVVEQDGFKLVDDLDRKLERIKEDIKAIEKLKPSNDGE